MARTTAVLYGRSGFFGLIQNGQLWLTGVGVEKGTKAVISVNFSAHGERTFNNLRTNFVGEIPGKEVFQHPQAISLIEDQPIRGQ
jgi:hypothetical protein